MNYLSGTAHNYKNSRERRLSSSGIYAENMAGYHMLLKFAIEEAIHKAMLSTMELTGNTSGYYL